MPENASWDAVGKRLREATPEAFGADGPANLIDGSWSDSGTPADQHSLADGSQLGALPKLAPVEGVAAVEAARMADRVAATPPWAGSLLVTRRYGR